MVCAKKDDVRGVGPRYDHAREQVHRWGFLDGHEGCYVELTETLACWTETRDLIRSPQDKLPSPAEVREQLRCTRSAVERAEFEVSQLIWLTRLLDDVVWTRDGKRLRTTLHDAALQLASAEKDHPARKKAGRPTRKNRRKMAWLIRHFWREHQLDESDGVTFSDKGEPIAKNKHCEFQMELLGLYAGLNARQCRSLLKEHLRRMPTDLAYLATLAED